MDSAPQHPLYQNMNYEVPSSTERVITIRGASIDVVSNAEAMISQKLRIYYESDMNMQVSKRDDITIAEQSNGAEWF